MSALDVIRMARAAGAKLTIEGSSLVLEADRAPPKQMFNMLRRHKPEILELLQAERRAVLRHITDHFQSSPLGWCAYCGSGERSGDPFVALFVDMERADVHASCHPKWFAFQESEARAALGFDRAGKEGRRVS